MAVGGSARGTIETEGDRDWFAVELSANKNYEYVFDLKGSETGDGTLVNPYLRGIHDADGALISGTNNDDGGTGRNSRVTFTPTEDGTYYVAAGGYGTGEGTYALEVTRQTVKDDDPIRNYVAADAYETGEGTHALLVEDVL